MQHLEPVLVLGSGRSGTSTVARVLHEHMGVLMGERFRPADETNPRGYYEDLDFRDPNAALLSGRIGEVDWSRAFERLLIDRRALGVSWGLKDPRICHVHRAMGRYVRWSRTVRTKRRERDVVASMCRCYGWTREKARELLVAREAALDQLPEPRVVVRMDDNPTDADLTEMLKEVAHG